MDERIPRYVTGITEMYQRKNAHSYAEQHRISHSIPPNSGHRHKRSKDHRIRRQIELEEDIVKTGSEDENEVTNKRRLRRRKGERNKRGDFTYSDMNKVKRVWRDKAYQNKDTYFLKFKSGSGGRRTRESNEDAKSQSSISKTPKVTYNGPMPHLSDLYGAVPVKKPISQEKSPPKQNMDNNYGAIPVRDKLPSYGKETTQTILPRGHVPGQKLDSGEVIQTDYSFKNARSIRASILNRAERLLHVRKLREETSSGEDGDTEKSDDPLVQRKIDYPSSDDDKYVSVKTTVSPTDSDIYTDLDVPLPPLPQYNGYRSRHSGKSLPSMIRSEMHMHSDEEHDMLHQQRPYTDSYREPPLFSVGRYEETKVNGMPQYGGVQSKIHKTGNRKGKMVTFFRNGDEYYTGLSLSIKPADFLNFESLLIYLNEKIAVPSGVRYIFSVPDGTEIRSVTDFQQGKSYVVSSTKLPNLEKKYGQSKYALWTNRKMSAGRIRKGEKELFQHTSSPSISTKNKHRVITVKNNLFRNISEKFYINPSTGQNFEDILTTLGDMTHVDIYALYTEKPPHRKVESFSQLFNEFRSHDYFIACGSEMVPLDMDSTKRPAPSSNSSGESVNGATRKKKSQENNDVDLDEIVENEDKKSPSPVQQRYNETPYDNNEVMTTARKEKDEIIKFDLRGKIREYYDPSITYPDDDGTRPGEKLKLEWIYGFGTKDLLVYPTGELLFYVAAVAVFYRKDDKLDTQRHYLGHTEEISCLTLHPNGFFVASGQYAGKESPAHIRIWDGNKLTTCQVIGIGFFNAGIASIGFSEESCGWYLCAVDTGEKHVLSIWDWEKESNGKLIAKTTTTNKGVACACFYKYDDTLLMTYGTDHLYFWRLFWDPNSEKEGKLYRDKLSGVLHDDFYPKQITAHTFSPTGDVLTGDSNGSIIVWSHDPEYVFRINKEASTVMKNIHKKAVTSLYVMGDNTLLSGGGYSIRSWDCNNFYRPMAIREIPEVTGTVRTIIPQRGIGTDGNIYVGTSRGCVLGGSLPTRFNIIFKGHFDEVWSTASFPDKSAFITAAHDQLVIRWCAITHKAFWRTQVESPCSAIAIDHRGSYVAVGSTAGRFFVLNATNGMHLITVHVGKAQINAMSFSPDDAMLAVGCHDGHIHLFYVHDDGKIYRKNNIILRGHSKFISNLDWSSDSKFLQSADSDFDLLFWNTQRMEKEDGRSLKKCNWSTYSCCAGYPIMGPWTSCENGEHLSVVSRSFNRKVIATGDNRGRIKLFKYPCATHSPACRWTKLYSTTVTALNFINEDSFLISSAGKSPILAQWSVIDTYARK